MISIVGLSGSLRKGSYNSMLLRAAAAAAPGRIDLITKPIRDIPLYDADVEESAGIPASVQAIKEPLIAADGLLLVTPEYNNSMPGTLKNAIDWMSRPPADIERVFRNKPVALMGASNGAGGTRFSQTAWLPVFRSLGLIPWFGAILYMDRAQNVFDDKGNVTDPKMTERLRVFMEGFADFIETQKRGRLKP